MTKLLLTLLMCASLNAYKVGEEVDKDHVVGPVGSPIHKVYWEYIKSKGYTTPVKMDEEKFDIDVIWIQELPAPEFCGGIWVKEKWIDENKEIQTGYYVDRKTGFLYRENKTLITQKYAKKMKLKGRSEKPLEWHANEQAQILETLFKCMQGPLLMIILQEKH